MKRIALFALGFGIVHAAKADIYLHNPPGSNRGALVTSIKSDAIRPEEVKTGHLAAGHRTWHPITFEMLGGKFATDDAAVKFVQTSYGTHRSVSLDFTNVATGGAGGRRVVYRIHFDGVKLNSLKQATVDGDPKLTTQFTFTKVTWTALDTGAVFTDTWSS